MSHDEYTDEITDSIAQEEVNVNFWNLVHKDAGILSTSLEHAARVREVLAENNRSIAIQKTIAALRYRSSSIIGPRTLPIDIDFLYRVPTIPPDRYGTLTPYMTPLVVAVSANNLALTRVLLEYAADCNHDGSEQYSGLVHKTTPLHCALRLVRHYGCHTRSIYDTEIIRLLLAYGASTNYIEPNGTTCLHLAAAQLSGRSYTGRAQHDPHNRPAFKAREDRMQLILAYTKPATLQHLLSTQDWSGQTPLMVAIHAAVFSQPDDHAIPLMLIDSTDDHPRSLDSTDDHPRDSTDDHLRGILEILDSRGLTAMGYCINSINHHTFHAGPVILRALLRKGAKTETRIDEPRRVRGGISGVSMTALHKACLRTGNHWAIEILLDAGADRKALDRYGLTPEAYALQHDMHEAIAIFAAYDLKKKCEAFAGAHHKRLGMDSAAGDLAPELMEKIIRNILKYSE
jgi:hypothetical protein